MSRLLLGTLLLFFPITLTGCGSGNPATVPVGGTVTFNEEPLKAGEIIFEPEEGRPAHGKIVDGKIVEVVTFEPNDGIIVGTHKVAITSLSPDPNDQSGMAMLSSIPREYGDINKSQLTAEIPATGKSDLEFKLTGKAP